MRSHDQIRIDYAVRLQANPDHGGAAQTQPLNRRFMQRSIDQIVRHQSKSERRARGRAARKARAVTRGSR